MQAKRNMIKYSKVNVYRRGIMSNLEEVKGIVNEVEFESVEKKEILEQKIREELLKEYEEELGY